MADLMACIASAIRDVRLEIRWRPGSAARHLQKRKRRGHLPAEATLDDYHHVIQRVLDDVHARVYVYWHRETPYVAVGTVLEESYWLVMFDLEGLLESAFVVERPERYLDKPVFQHLGSLDEVIR